jgi:hypothetical protein
MPHGSIGRREVKESAADDRSKLQLNAKLVKSNPKRWNGAAIERRALELIDAVRIIWSGALTQRGSS